MTTATATMSNRTKDTAAAGYETELRAAARRCGLTMKELAAEDGCHARLPVGACLRAQAMDSEDA